MEQSQVVPKCLISADCAIECKLGTYAIQENHRQEFKLRIKWGFAVIHGTAEFCRAQAPASADSIRRGHCGSVTDLSSDRSAVSLQTLFRESVSCCCKSAAFASRDAAFDSAVRDCMLVCATYNKHHTIHITSAVMLN